FPGLEAIIDKTFAAICSTEASEPTLRPRNRPEIGRARAATHHSKLGEKDRALPPPNVSAAVADALWSAGYDVLGELGRGGMGVVYLARKVKLNRLCALKMILAGAHAGSMLQARFRSEAEAVARLRHPGIVQIYHVGEVEGLPFLELEYVS